MEKLLDINETAAFLGISINTIYTARQERRDYGASDSAGS